MEKIYKRQLGFLFVLIIPITKVIMLPCLLARQLNSSSIMTILAFFIADLIILFAAFFVYKLSNKKGVISIYERTTGKVFCKILMAVYAIFFIAKSIPIVVEQNYFLYSTLYEVTPQVLNIYPVFAIGGYMAYKGIKTIGRNADLFIFPMLICFIIILIFGLIKFNLGHLFPFFENGAAPVIKSGFNYIFYFGESVTALFLLDKLEDENILKGKSKNSNKPIWFFILAYSIVISFYFIFIMMFGPTAGLKEGAISKLSIYAISLNNYSRIDFLFIVPLLANVFFAVAIYMYLAIELLCYVFSIKNRGLVTFILSGTLIIAVIFINGLYFQFVTFYQRFLNYFMLVMQYIIPLITVVFAALVSKKEVKAVGKVSEKI